MVQMIEVINGIGSALIALFVVFILGFVSGLGSFGPAGFVLILAAGVVTGVVAFSFFQWI
jgi:hypothetical protein